MRLALNGSTLGPCTLAEELDAASRAGFSLVELRAPKLEGVRNLAGLLSAHGIQAWSVNSLEGAGERDLDEEARRLAAWAASCGCPYVVCVPGRERQGLEEAVARLARICAAEGATLAFEFMGFPWAAVRSLGEALRVHDGPVVIDTFHWVLGDRNLHELAALDPARLAVVHVNDAPSRDLAALGDADRVLPGEGVLDLQDFYSTLRAIGFDGVCSVELFNPRLWADGPLLAARRSHQALEALASW
jgi:2-keto-myo-inositol isomerase